MARRIVLAAWVLVAFLSLSFVRPWAAEKVKVATTVRDHPANVMPVLAALEQGFFKQNGLEAEWISFLGDAATMKALVARSVDAGLGGTPGVIISASRGVPVVIVADMQVKDYGFRIWVLTDSPIKSAADLKGKKIGTNMFGGISHSYGIVAMKAVGLERDTRFLALGGGPQTIAGLKAGAVDAIMGTIFKMANVKVKGEVREVLNPYDFFPAKWSEIVIFSRKDIAKERPDTVKRMVKATLAGASFTLTNRTWALEKLSSHFGFLGDVSWLYQRTNFGKDGRIDREAIENVRNFLMEYGILPKERPVPLEGLYTLEFTS